VFADEHPGPEVRRALLERVRHVAIPVLPSMYVTRLLVDDGTVFAFPAGGGEAQPARSPRMGIRAVPSGERR
jgi:hypothetical protein